ncbi:SIS domain-containing protein [Chelatococcus reniformis]|uniref:SIS domain-containing protein n=1 Tax=Chelatococcus reniformis TaxID=1494448 RepID=UPI001AEDA941|nr:SIS domain-containing protein [Chelatococcus reniformis]
MIETVRAIGPLLEAHDFTGIEHVTLVGSGSSLNAATAAAAFVGAADSLTAEAMGATPFLARRRLPNAKAALVVVLTQTGASATSIAAARAAADAGARILVITANGDSDAARLALPTLLLPIGAETIGPKTKGYAASCAALFALAARLGAPVPEPPGLHTALMAALAAAARRAGALAAGLDAADHVMVAGDGASHGIALEGSLKIAEIAGLPTSAYTMEEMLHGRLHGLTEHSLCMPIATDAPAQAEAQRVREVMAPLGVRVEPVEAAPARDLPAPWSTLAAAFVFQHLAVALCLRRGRDPDLMRYPGLTHRFDIKTDLQP